MSLSLSLWKVSEIKYKVGTKVPLAAPTIILDIMDFNIISLEGTLLGPSLLCAQGSLKFHSWVAIWAAIWAVIFFLWRSRPKPTTVTSKLQKLAPQTTTVKLVGNGNCAMGIRIAPNPRPGIGLVLKVHNRDPQKKIKYPVRIPTHSSPKKNLNTSNNRPENQWFFPVVSRNLTVLCQLLRETGRFFASSFTKPDGS
jgi:hypothetical protein